MVDLEVGVPAGLLLLVLSVCWLRAVFTYYKRRQARYRNAYEGELAQIDEEMYSITGNLVKEITNVPITQQYSFQDVLLGRGASAHVVIGVNKKTQRRYAIKVIDTSTKNIAWKYERELDILRLTDHTNIVRVYEMYRVPTALCFVMELCTGGHLGLVMKQAGGVLDQTTALSYVTQIARAIFHCHSQGIVHRDIKLQNILLESNGRDAQIKLVDFGNSARFSASTLPLRKIVGTTYTAAPEVFKQEYDERCDIWSLGVVTYILLSGRRPFESVELANQGGQRSKESSIIANILIGRYHFLHACWEIVSDAAVHFIKTCLVVDYRRRVRAEECLQHPWLMHPDLRSDVISQLSIQNARSAKKYSSSFVRNISSSDIRRTTMLGVAFHLPNGKLQQLRSLFQSIDKSGRGYIRVEQFRSVMTTLNPAISAVDIDLIFAAIDSTDAGCVSFTEFVAATLDPRDVDITELNRSFRLLDHTGKGYIDRNDLRRVLSADNVEETQPEVDGLGVVRTNSVEEAKDATEKARLERVKRLNQRILDMIEAVDMDKDGVISYTEFLFAMADGGSNRIKLTSPAKASANAGVGSSAAQTDPAAARPVNSDSKGKFNRRQSDSAVKISNNYSTRRSSIESASKLSSDLQGSFGSFFGFRKASSPAVRAADSGAAELSSKKQQENIAEFVKRPEGSVGEDDEDHDTFNRERERRVPSVGNLMWTDVRIKAGIWARRMTGRPPSDVSLKLLEGAAAASQQNAFADDSNSDSDDSDDYEVINQSRRLSSPALLWQSLSRRASNFALAMPRKASNFGLGLGLGPKSMSLSHPHAPGAEPSPDSGNSINSSRDRFLRPSSGSSVSIPEMLERGEVSPSSPGSGKKGGSPEGAPGDPNLTQAKQESPAHIYTHEDRSGGSGEGPDSAEMDPAHMSIVEGVMRAIAKHSSSSNEAPYDSRAVYDSDTGFLKTEAMEMGDDETLNIDDVPAALRKNLGIERSVSLNTLREGSSDDERGSSKKQRKTRDSLADDDSDQSDNSMSQSMDSHGGSSSLGDHTHKEPLSELVSLLKTQQGSEQALTPDDAALLAEQISMFHQSEVTSGNYVDNSNSMDGSRSSSASSNLPTIYESSRSADKPKPFLNSMFNAFLKGLQMGEKGVRVGAGQQRNDDDTPINATSLSKPEPGRPARRMSIG